MPYFGIYGLEFLEKLWYLKWAISILTNWKILRKEKKKKKKKFGTKNSEFAYF